ncbi:MAG TPA: protein-methionine-sulfoxide reductase heme-binding subunit MsrQ [Tepidisphaeraceae bacterium]|jgi:sulfoxide reductase heme-binding subunit YedZ
MKPPRFATFAVWVNGAVPGLLLLWDAWHGRLGANPVQFAIRTTGLLALIFLGLSLLITPLRQLTGVNALFPHRRTLGLYAAIYAFAHLTIFFWFDRQRSVAGTWHEIVTRTYLWFGAIALLALVPLTITSTQRMVHRLGAKRWKALHRLAYVAAVAAVVHYCLAGKILTVQAVAFTGVIGLLLLYRLAAPWFKPKPRARVGKQRPPTVPA